MYKKISVILILCLFMTGCGRLVANPESSSTTTTPEAVAPTEPAAAPTSTVAPTVPAAAPTVAAIPTEAAAVPTAIADSIEASDSGVTPIGIKIMNGRDAEEPILYIFLNDKEGWKAVLDAQGMFKEDITLYKTEDGGSNWTKLTSTMDEAATIPLASKTGLIFTDSMNGWLTTEIPQEGYIGLYKTSDGGVTWKQQQLDIPKDYTHVMFGTYPPVFFSASDGILLSFAYGDGSADQMKEQLVYVTHDGGNTWTSVKENDDKVFQWSLQTNAQEGKQTGWTVIYNNTTWYTTDMLSWKSK